jgi:putative selenium metabolism hydrolase
LTAGETKESVVEELKGAIALAGEEAEIIELFYDRPSYTGLSFPVEKYFPTWVMEEDSGIVRKTVATYREVFGADPLVDKWTFSTNGIATAGVFSIPTIGFGPANEIYAHSPDDQCPVDHLVRAAAMYALLPLRLSQ